MILSAVLIAYVFWNLDDVFGQRIEAVSQRTVSPNEPKRDGSNSTNRTQFGTETGREIAGSWSVDGMARVSLVAEIRVARESLTISLVGVVPVGRGLPPRPCKRYNPVSTWMPPII